jgi:serine/threonine protein kinase
VPQSGSTDTRYACKQSSKETEIESFYQEENNLERVRQLQDLHIVQITKSYRKGSDFNIVFSRAKANLRQCLTMPEYSFHDLTTGPIRQAGVWVQMRGLARALDRIINYDPRVDNPGVVFQSRENKSDSPQILGYYFNLKHFNILVYDDEDGENNILKISDFGQAKFNARVDDSRTTNPGGADVYAAPEAITDSESRLNTRYDIWSLGCIFLELVTFLLRKYQGVQDFGNARRKQFNRQISSRFFDELRDPLRGQRHFMLRNAIKEWIEDLLSPELRSDDHDAKFLLKVKGLLLGMLEVDARKRYSSKQVYLELERITAEAVTLDVSSQAPVLNDLSSEEVEINGQKIGSLSRLYARNKRQPQAKLHTCTAVCHGKFRRVGNHHCYTGCPIQI